MSLRKQLTDLLSAILPSNPKEAIKGTELIRLVRMQLEGDYSDASLRYHFSIMSCDPASPIAKVEKGQGYYKRTAPVPALTGAQEMFSMRQARLDEVGGDGGELSRMDAAMERIKKFRAIVIRYYEVSGRFPFVFRDAFSEESPISNLWKYPEVVLVDWETGDAPDEEMTLDSAALSLKSNLGLPPCTLAAARLRIIPALETFREDFFQCLSASKWAQQGELIYALPIEDEALGDALRALAQEFGIGITTFGLSPEILDDLPRASNIINAHPRETEALMSRLDVTRIAASKNRSHVDWSALAGLRSESSEVNELLAWLQSCISEGKATAYTTVS